MKPMLKTAQTQKRTAHTIAAGLQNRFREHYAARARIYRAPGRVNLIGEHTDYNDGLVMPAAIDFYVWVGVSPRNDRRLLSIPKIFPRASKSICEKISFARENIGAIMWRAWPACWNKRNAICRAQIF